MITCFSPLCPRLCVTHCKALEMPCCLCYCHECLCTVCAQCLVVVLFDCITISHVVPPPPTTLAIISNLNIQVCSQLSQKTVFSKSLTVLHRREKQVITGKLLYRNYRTEANHGMLSNNKEWLMIKSTHKKQPSY